MVGSVVAPVWTPTGGGSAMGRAEDRQHFLQQVEKACAIAQKLRNLGIRPYGSFASIRPQVRQNGLPIQKQTQQQSRPHYSRLRILPRILASVWQPKVKSAGQACTAGGICCNCWRW